MTPLAGETAGQRIARARRRRALSKAVLAGLMGRSESWLSQVERGKRYLITGAAGHWIAHRWDNGRMLAASSPDGLRELIIEDYAGQQVPRGTERHARA